MLPVLLFPLLGSLVRHAFLFPFPSPQTLRSQNPSASPFLSVLIFSGGFDSDFGFPWAMFDGLCSPTSQASEKIRSDPPNSHLRRLRSINGYGSGRIGSVRLLGKPGQNPLVLQNRVAEWGRYAGPGPGRV